MPRPGSGEVRVEIRAAGVNPVDTQNRADGAWAEIEAPAILGSDYSGVVDDVGPLVAAWAPGQDVFGLAPFRGCTAGTYAEYHVTSADSLLPKPRNLDHTEAAAVPLAAGTAYTALVKRLALRPDEVVLIHGAGGGVGTFAVQIAQALGARVIAVASRRHHGLLADLGVRHCLDYRDEDLVANVSRLAPGGVDAIFDVVGSDTLASSLPLLREGARGASIVGLEGDLELAIDRNLTLHGVLLDARDREVLEAVRDLCEAGSLRPIVSRVYPLHEVADAHRHIEAGHVQGKVVLSVP